MRITPAGFESKKPGSFRRESGLRTMRPINSERGQQTRFLAMKHDIALDGLFSAFAERPFQIDEMH